MPYRLALLLTGDASAAEELLATTLRDAAPQLAQFRNAKTRDKWLAGELRRRCLQKNSAQPAETSETPPLAADNIAVRIHALPEPGRSAFALFCLDIFSADDLADILGLDISELANALADARAKL